MEIINSLIGNLGNFIWGPIMLCFLIGTGLYLTIGLKGTSLTKVPLAFKLLLKGREKSEHHEGDISPYQALMTSLAATVGTGNIAGVASAIFLGGPGAVFWMWISALVGMASKLGEAVLAVKYREYNPEIKNFSGGPMYYIKNGMGSKWKWLGFLFALFGALACFGTGCSVQANSISQVMKSNFGIPTFVTGIILAILTYFVVIGGIKRIGEVTEKLVPFMAIGYIIGTLAIIFVNYTEVLPAFKLIVVSAFKGHAMIGGFAGATVQQAIRYGIARGVFSNEAGLGTAAIAHASAVVRRPGEQGIIGILGGFLDTIIICSMTAFAILVTSGWTSGKTGADLTVYAFNQGLSGFGGYVVVFGLLFFAFSTIIGWCYYGEKCFEYIFGAKVIKLYRYLWVIGVFLGSIAQLNLVWDLADVMNGFMMIPNLIALIVLSPVVFKEMKEYFEEVREIKNK